MLHPVTVWVTRRVPTKVSSAEDTPVSDIPVEWTFRGSARWAGVDFDRRVGRYLVLMASGEDGLASERDFYRRLLDLGGQEEIEPLLDQALALIVEVTGASTAYLELYDDAGEQPRFWKGRGVSERDVAAIRTSISHGITARAISEARTIETPPASLDERFQDLGSVRQHAIQ